MALSKNAMGICWILCGEAEFVAKAVADGINRHAVRPFVHGQLVDAPLEPGPDKGNGVIGLHLFKKHVPHLIVAAQVLDLVYKFVFGHRLVLLLDFFHFITFSPGTQLKMSADKKWLLFPFPFAIIPSQMQDSYIGNTTASQARVPPDRKSLRRSDFLDSGNRISENVMLFVTLSKYFAGLVYR